MILRCYENGTPDARIHVVITLGSAFVETKCNRLIRRKPGGAAWHLDTSNDKHLALISRAMCAHCRRLIAPQLVPW